MTIQLYFSKKYWQVLCSVLMVIALAITILGTLPFFAPRASFGPMGGLGEALLFLYWLFGVSGLTIFFLENTPAKTPLIIGGMAWSIIALAWGMVAHECPYNQECLYDGSLNNQPLTACLSACVVLLIYNKAKEKIPILGKKVIKLFARSMIAVWTCALLFGVVNFINPYL